MPRDTIADWQSLTQLYREMGDEELYELAANIGDLTEVAQQVLRDEMKSRKLPEQREVKAPRSVERISDDELTTDLPLDEDGANEEDQPHEYTWKTLLCECERPVEALEIRETLKQAGVESWIEGPRSIVSFESGSPRVLVAADQLEQASDILARGIPQAIIDQFEGEVPEFEAPVCPSCGAEDPVLESVDPSNTWECESCGKQWTEAVNE
jgi:hypothetical protein